MINKKLKIVGMTVTILCSAGMGTTAESAAAVVQDDLLQDAGSWMQIVGEGSLKVVDPSLEKARIWVEGQSRWDDNWNHWYQGMARASAGPSIKTSESKGGISISTWMMQHIPTTPCTT